MQEVDAGAYALHPPRYAQAVFRTVYLLQQVANVAN